MIIIIPPPLCTFDARNGIMAYITLLSDIGLQDASVAITKGILMQCCPGCLIADITHNVTPFHTRQAAYLLGSAFRNFPAGSYHILLFDVFARKETTLLLSRHEDHYFLWADNGCLPLALGTLPEQTWQCTGFSKKGSFHEWINMAGAVIKALELKEDIPGIVPYVPRKYEQQNDAVSGAIACEVIHIDRYENVVLDLTRHQFESAGAGRSFRLQFTQVEEINEISNNYSDVRQGFKLCRFNSNGHMEICINRGKAASLFGLRLGSRNNQIKLFFE